MAEALVRTIKRDYVRVSPRPGAETVMRQLPALIAHYNEVHPHKALGYRSPVSSSQLTQDLTVSGRSELQHQLAGFRSNETTRCVTITSFIFCALVVRTISWSVRFHGGRSSSTPLPRPEFESNLISAPIGLSGLGIPSGVTGKCSETYTYLYAVNLGKIVVISAFERCWSTWRTKHTSPSGSRSRTMSIFRNSTVVKPYGAVPYQNWL